MIKPKPFSLFFFDVGQGDSIGGILHSSKKKAFLIDIANAEIINSFPEFEYIEEFNFIIITHNDLDHYKGLYDLIENYSFRTRILYLAHDRGPKSPQNETYIKLLKDIYTWEENGMLEAKGLDSDRQITYDSVEIKILHPTYAFLGKMIAENKWNDASVVVKVSYQDKVVLLTGDIQEKGINELLKNNDNLKCDVLKIPHHGSYPPNDAIKKLTKNTKPLFAIISVGTNNSFKHPHKKTMNHLKSENISIFCTEATAQCCSNINKAREKINKIILDQQNYKNCLSNNNVCPCAGTIIIEINDGKLQIVPNNAVLSSTKDDFDAKLCE
jgi:competence protein ComEC